MDGYLLKYNDDKYVLYMCIFVEFLLFSNSKILISNGLNLVILLV